jgi:hypothetical protein
MNNIITALLLTLLSALPVYSQLDTLGPSPLPVMSGDREIRIPADTKSYEISFADKKVALESIHAILGHFSASKPQYADVGYYPDAEGNPCGKDAAPCLIVGSQNNHYVGIAVWKVILPDSSPLRGGVAEFDVTFVGRPQAQKNKLFVAVTESYSPNANNLSLISLPPEGSMRTIADTSDAHGNYRETISIPLPQGAAELFLIVADAGSSARMGVSRITLKAPADK